MRERHKAHAHAVGHSNRCSFDENSRFHDASVRT